MEQWKEEQETPPVCRATPEAWQQGTREEESFNWQEGMENSPRQC